MQKTKTMPLSVFKKKTGERFELNQPPLFRLHLIKQDHDHYTLLESSHHSITDGWSGPLLLNTVHEYYAQLIEGKSPKIKKDTAYHRAQSYIAQHQAQAESYWQGEIQKIEAVNDLNALLSQPTDLDQLKQLADPREVTLI